MTVDMKIHNNTNADTLLSGTNQAFSLCQTNQHAPIPLLVSMPTPACTRVQAESDNSIQVKVLAKVNTRTR